LTNIDIYDTIIDMEVAIYTLEQAANKFGIHKETLRKKAKAGKINGFRVGNQWRFTDQDIQEFIDRNRSR